MNTKLLLILLVTGSVEILPHSTIIGQPDKEYCSDEKRLGYFHPADSTRRQVILDSVNTLLVGRWRLIDIGTRTYTVMPAPEDSIEVNIDKQSNSIVYRQGKRMVDFQLAAGINYGNLRCAISEVGRDYFGLRPSRVEDARVKDGLGEMNKGEVNYPNGLRVCEDYLEIYAFTSAGPYYVFKRLTPVQLENKQRN